MIQGKESTAGDLKRLYGFLGKVNGIIGIEAEHGEDYQSEISQAEQKGLDKVTMAPTPETSFSPSPESRLSNINMTSPVRAVDMAAMPTTADPGPTGKVDSRTASMLFPDDKIFTPDTFAAQGGIMNARKPIQRVA